MHVIKMSWTKFFIYLDIIVPSLVLVTAVIILSTRRARITPADTALLSFLILQTVLNGLANSLQDRQINNHWIYHLNSILTQCVFSVYFFSEFKEPPKKQFVLITFAFFVCFFIINILFFQPYDTFNSYSYALGALLIVVYGLLNFYSWTELIPTRNILILKEFWAAAGILFYFGSSFFIFISYHYLSIVSYNTVGILWRLHNVFLALGCFIFLKAIVVKQWIK